MSYIEEQRYVIEIDGREVLWFEASAKSEAYATYSKLVSSSQYDNKELLFRDVQTETDLGYRGVLLIEDIAA